MDEQKDKEKAEILSQPQFVMRIPLSRGLSAIVDKEDFDRFKNYKWSVAQNGGTFYAVRGEYIGNGKSRSIYLHRQILDAPKDRIVDHKDGNGLNNRRINLRLCTHAENLWNRGKNKNNTSGYKGVYYHKQTGKFITSIWFHHKEIYLGLFRTAQGASSAYQVAAKKFHGNFARN